MTTPEPDQVAEVLARVAGEHLWHHTAKTHCACGWRSPLAQLAVDGYLAHLVAVQAAALRSAGLVVEGTEIEEWSLVDGAGVRYTTEEWADPWSRADAEWARAQGEHADRLERRTVTRYPDRVTEWVAVDEGGE